MGSDSIPTPEVGQLWRIPGADHSRTERRVISPRPSSWAEAQDYVHWERDNRHGWCCLPQSWRAWAGRTGARPVEADDEG